MAQIKTRIIIRNDSTVNWQANATQVLLKGELGIEFLDSGEAKLKIGDGVKKWDELDYFGGTNYFGDDKSIKVLDGIVSLLGFDSAEVGSQPRKKADGEIEWIKLDPTTVEGLESDVKSIRNTIGTVEGEQTLIDRINANKEAIATLNSDETVEGSVDKKIIDQLAKQLADAPENLDTLKELSDWIAGHADSAAEMNTQIQNKVDKVEGKGLSSNDLTDELLGKLNKSEQNVIDTININGTALPVNEKVVNIGIAGITLGVVKASEAQNKVAIDENGEMEVNSINVNKLVQDEGSVLILNGGSSNITEGRN